MSAALQKAKGPAATGIAPDHGSTHINGHMDMNKHSNTTAAAANPDFPIPYIMQGAADDLRDAMALFALMDHFFDEGYHRGMSKELVRELAVMFSVARQSLGAILRYLEDDHRDGNVEMYRTARRAEIVRMYQAGQS